MRLAVATRSMNHFLYEASGELLGLGRPAAGGGELGPRHRLTGTDSFGYFRELLRFDADWVINLDEDAFVLAPERLLDLVRVMEEGASLDQSDLTAWIRPILLEAARERIAKSQSAKSQLK
jgi:hypothetical protein